MLKGSRTFLIGAGLFALNAAICWPLFGIEYLDDFQTNEGSWIAFAKFLREYWPHVRWFPWFDGGMPFENTYLPGLTSIVALASMIAQCSPAHAFHFVVAVAYSLAPVSLFLFALGVSGRLAPSVWSGVMWSLMSPSLISPILLQEMGTPWGIRRLRDIVFWGDIPHNAAICLLPISLLLTWRYLEKPTARRFALAAFAAASVMLMNAFGLAVVLLSSVLLFATQRRLSWKMLAAVGGIHLSAYLVVCRFLPPSLIRLMETNAQWSGGDFRFSSKSVAIAAGFLAILIALWATTRRLSSPILQFAILFSACFGGIIFLGFLPQPLRYHLELEPALCLLAVFLLEPLLRKVPLKAGLALAALPLAWITFKDVRFARDLIHPVDIAHSLPFREARWIAENLPDQRILDAAEGQYLFNLFADNPQMSAGHEPSSPNWVQHVAIYTIYTGQGAGPLDGPISVLWLKAFGCGAIVVPGRESKDHYHAIANPDKFEGLLPLVWRESGDSIYQVQKSPSLAHVIPRSTVVTTRPQNGLDVTQLRLYVDALETQASMVWENPDHAKIAARMDPSQVLSVQITYDPGWEARVEGRKVKVRADGLGLILIEPECSDCSVDLEFTGGPERQVTLAVSIFTLAALLAMLFIRTHL
jgi:hypothetical protein